MSSSLSEQPVIWCTYVSLALKLRATLLPRRDSAQVWSGSAPLHQPPSAWQAPVCSHLDVGLYTPSSQLCTSPLRQDALISGFRGAFRRV